MNTPTRPYSPGSRATHPLKLGHHRWAAADDKEAVGKGAKARSQNRVAGCLTWTRRSAVLNVVHGARDGSLRRRPGPNSFDMQAAIERWVERGSAPENIVATHSTNGVVDRLRPLCPYPKVAVCKGKGDTNDEGTSSAAIRM